MNYIPRHYKGNKLDFEHNKSIRNASYYALNGLMNNCNHSYMYLHIVTPSDSVIKHPSNNAFSLWLQLFKKSFIYYLKEYIYNALYMKVTLYLVN